MLQGVSTNQTLIATLRIFAPKAVFGERLRFAGMNPRCAMKKYRFVFAVGFQFRKKGRDGPGLILKAGYYTRLFQPLIVKCSHCDALPT